MSRWGQHSAPEDRHASRGFALLLARLGHEPLQAGDEFERLRRTLTRFFEWRGALRPDECTDQTLDRLAHKLSEGAEVTDLFAFARGVARLVLLEQRRENAREVSLAGIEPADRRNDRDQESPFTRHLDRCLASLTSEERELVIGYYTEHGRSKIERRQALARQLGVNEAALRNRVQRLRDRLERCVRDRIEVEMGRRP
jgi:DNA-directed RNA polymerase specialized sigma24 family protein